MDVRLKFLFGALSGQTVPLAAGELVIGRDKDCGLGPMSDFVSRQHCVLTLADDRLTIRDLGSKNGTFVNGDRVGQTPTDLTHGALVSVGDFIFQIDLLSPVIPAIAAAETAGTTATEQAMAGTGVFNGDTIDASNPSRNPPPATSPPVAPPVPQEQAVNDPSVEADARPS
jgi:pSer/pThr/pTyr-binding forkhead associated (FHA) protein